MRGNSRTAVSAPHPGCAQFNFAIDAVDIPSFVSQSLQSVAIAEMLGVGS